MKKILLATAVLMISAAAAFAQKFDNVRSMYLLKQFEKAKAELGKNMNDAKYKAAPETYMWKMALAAEYYNDPKLAATNPNARAEAYEALQQYYKMDPTMKALKDNNAFGALNILHVNTFNDGLKAFQENRWDDAFNGFQLSVNVDQLVKDAGIMDKKLDTVRVLYTGYAAQNAKKIPEALNYYGKIADAKLGGKDYLEMYQYMLANYSAQGDATNFNKYLAIAKELYPTNEVWTDLEMEFLGKTLSFAQLMDQYKKADAAGSLSAAQYSGYGNAIASNKDELEKLDSASKATALKVAADAFAKAYTKKSSGIDAYNAGVMYYNEWTILDDRFASYKGTTPALKAKRDEIEKEQQAVSSTAIEWLEKAYTDLKAQTSRNRTENQVLNRTVDFLSTMFAWKRDKARGKAPQDVDKFDAKYKQYDAEHNKY